MYKTVPLARSEIAQFNYESTFVPSLAQNNDKTMYKLSKTYFVVPKVIYTPVRVLYL